jgi:Acyl-CoA dehydrogenase, C-terminal domain
MSSFSYDDDEFLAAACEAVRRSPGDTALDALGWWDFLGELSDPEARAAVFALFRAQGRGLGDTRALGGLLAQPYPGLGGSSPGSVSVAVGRRSRRRGEVLLLAGPVPTEAVLIDRPGVGAAFVSLEDVELEPVEVPGRLTLHEVRLSGAAIHPEIADGEAEPARRRSAFLGRVAAAHEMLGAAEAVLALAVDYAGAREQFGQPIGTFQAVRHLLAWARTDCAAIEAVAGQAVNLDEGAVPDLDRILKALAGRNARRVCERTLQTFGGIGFTAEHDHHHFHSRVLALDSVLGTSAELMADLGAELRRSEVKPRIAAAIMAGSMTEIGDAARLA